MSPAILPSNSWFHGNPGLRSPSSWSLTDVGAKLWLQPETVFYIYDNQPVSLGLIGTNSTRLFPEAAHAAWRIWKRVDSCIFAYGPAAEDVRYASIDVVFLYRHDQGDDQTDKLDRLSVGCMRVAVIC